MEYTNESAQRAYLRALDELNQQLADLVEAFQPASAEQGMGDVMEQTEQATGRNKEDL